MSSMLVVLDRQGRVEFLNQRAADVLGWPRDELLGRDWLEDCLPERLRASVRSGFGCLMTGELATTVDVIHAVLTRDGREREVRWRNSVRLDAGVVSGTVSVGDPVEGADESPDARRALIYADLFDHAPVGVLALARSGRIHLANAWIARRLGVTVAQTIGRDALELFAESDRPRLRTWFTELRAGGDVDAEPASFLGARGAASVQITALAVRDREGAPDELRIALTDVSELEGARKDIARANAALVEFAYAASHDLQEPLRTIRGLLELLEAELGSDLGPDAAEWLRLSIDGAKRLQTLVRDLLSYSRVNTRAKPLERSSLRPILRSALAGLTRALDDSGGTVEIGQLPELDVDPTQMTQVFQNLIANAIKFARAGVPPVIKIGAAEHAEGWILTVEDNGIGIDPAQTARVFEVCARLHTREQYDGNGIGLALVKRIIERHRGRVWVEPRTEGTCIAFTLPRTYQV